MELLDIYLLNLFVTIGMFVTLTFRAWIELKNFRMMWREMEWRRTAEVARKVLIAEKDLFSRIEGGEELFDVLCRMFGAEEK